MTIGEEIVENLDLPLDRIIQELDAGRGKLPEDAIREAQTTACGPLTGSMDDRIACSKVQPVSRQCRTL